MERKTYLKRYRLDVDAVGIPTVIRRSAGEATFQADEISSGEQVAVQVVPPGALREATRSELIAEGDSAKKIQHINIPALRDFGFEGGQLICVTDYFEGTTAEEWVKTKGPLPITVVLRIASQVVSALSAATFHGVRHHAITPGSLMLVAGQTTEGEWPLIKVLNLIGVAAPENAFVSPEQARGDEIDFRSQIYSLGGVLWFLLKGVQPSPDAIDALEKATDLPAPIRRLLQPMLEADPELRPLDPLVVEEQIQLCLAQVERRDAVASKFGLPPAAAEPAATIADTYPSRRARPWVPITLAAVLVGAATFAAIFLAQRTRWHEALGIPIGVPEASTNAVGTVPATEANPSPDPAAVISPEETEPAVLTSNAGPPAEETTSPNESSETTPVAANEASQEGDVAPTEPVASLEEEKEKEIVANIAASARPSPPSEGPAEAAPAPTSTPGEIVAATPALETAMPSPSVAAVEVRNNVTPPVATHQQERATEPLKTTKPARSKTSGTMRIIAPAATPSGNIFPPSHEPVYAAPRAPVSRETPRRRSRPTMRDGQRELPVLPALPPDE